MAASMRIPFCKLSKVGVRILDETKLWFRCQSCGTTWCPELTPAGHVPLDYWKCPNGCNCT
jgi:transposase-like protein